MNGAGRRAPSRLRAIRLLSSFGAFCNTATFFVGSYSHPSWERRSLKPRIKPHERRLRRSRAPSQMTFFRGGWAGPNASCKPSPQWPRSPQHSAGLASRAASPFTPCLQLSLRLSNCRSSSGCGVPRRRVREPCDAPLAQNSHYYTTIHYTPASPLSRLHAPRQLFLNC